MGRIATIAVCLAAAGCKQAPPPPARFCDQDLSGLWLNSSDRHFAYRFRDDGGVVEGEFLQRADDGGLTAPADAITFKLRRGPEAVGGIMRGSGETEGGRTCPIEFDTRITDCKPDSLQVVTETTAPIDEQCQRLKSADGGPIPGDLTEFRFERAK